MTTTGFPRIASGITVFTLVLGSCLLAASCGGGSSSTGKGGSGGTATGAGGAGGTTAGSGGTGTGGTTAGSGGATATGGATGAGGASGPVQTCYSLASTLCARDNTCNKRGGTAQDLATCANEQVVAFGCDRATSAGFTTCLTDVQAVSCATLFDSSTQALNLPGSCSDPIQSTPLSAAQNACADVATAFCNREFQCENVAAPSSSDQATCQQDYFDSILACLFVESSNATALTKCEADIGQLPCPTGDGGASDGGADGGVSLPNCDQALTYVP